MYKYSDYVSKDKTITFIDFVRDENNNQLVLYCESWMKYSDTKVLKIMSVEKFRDEYEQRGNRNY